MKVVPLEWEGFHVGAFLQVAEQFSSESNHNTGFDRDTCVSDVYQIFLDPTCTVLLIFSDEWVPAGAAILMTDSMFMGNMTFGYTTKFYICPAFRGTGAGRALLAASLDWFKSMGTKKVFATSTGGVGQDKQFINLYKKYGFSECGVALEKELT